MEKKIKNKVALKLFIADERMLKLMAYVNSISLKGIKTQSEFCEIIDLNKTAINPIRKGDRGFTPKQILNACKHFNVDVAWVFGLSENMFREEAKTPMQKLKEAVIAIEDAYGPKANTSARPYVKKNMSKKVSTIKQ